MLSFTCLPFLLFCRLGLGGVLINRDVPGIYGSSRLRHWSFQERNSPFIGTESFSGIEWAGSSGSRTIEGTPQSCMLVNLNDPRPILLAKSRSSSGRSRLRKSSVGLIRLPFSETSPDPVKTWETGQGRVKPPIVATKRVLPPRLLGGTPETLRILSSAGSIRYGTCLLEAYNTCPGRVG